MTVMCGSPEHNTLSVAAVLGLCMVLLPPIIMLRVLYLARIGMVEDVTAMLSNAPVGENPTVSVEWNIKGPSIRYRGVLNNVRWVEEHVSPIEANVTADV